MRPTFPLLNPFTLCTHQGSSNYQLLKSSGMTQSKEIKCLMVFKPGTSRIQGRCTTTEPSTGQVVDISFWWEINSWFLPDCFNYNLIWWSCCILIYQCRHRNRDFHAPAAIHLNLPCDWLITVCCLVFVQMSFPVLNTSLDEDLIRI